MLRTYILLRYETNFRLLYQVKMHLKLHCSTIISLRSMRYAIFLSSSFAYARFHQEKYVNFQGCVYCLILNYQGSLLLFQNSLHIISNSFQLVNIFLNQFQSYLSSFILLSLSNSDILSYPVFLVNNFFKSFTRNGEGGI